MHFNISEKIFKTFKKGKRFFLAARASFKAFLSFQKFSELADKSIAYN